MDKLDPSGGIIKVRGEDRKDLFEKLILFLGFTINEAQQKKYGAGCSQTEAERTNGRRITGLGTTRGAFEIAEIFNPINLFFRHG